MFTLLIKYGDIKIILNTFLLWWNKKNITCVTGFIFQKIIIKVNYPPK